MDPGTDQWFQAASGFSGHSLSVAIRAMIFLLAMVWGGFIVKGFMKQMNESDDPMGWFSRLCLLMIFLTALWVILY